MSIVRIANLLRDPRKAFSKEDGFSLIEVMAALFIFTLLTLGLVPLLTSSIRGSNTARADTIGKNSALKAMERVRGLPFYVSYATSTTKVDLLDLYYPDAATDVVVGGRTLYRITCSSAALTNPACPRDIPTNYTLTFDAQFVDPVATGTQPSPGESATSYANVVPPATYAWSSANTDTPPRQVVQMTVTATWTVGASNESYALTSLLSDRSFGGRKVKGTATLGYGVDFYAAYDTKKNATGNLKSTSNLFIMRSESDIESRRVSSARQNTTATRFELERDTGLSLRTADGATSSSLVAPPDQTPATVTSVQRTVTHPDWGTPILSGFGPSNVSNLNVSAASALPAASGDTEITGVISGTTEYVFAKDPQLGNDDFNGLNLSSTGTGGGGPSLMTMERFNGLTSPLPGITSPVNTGLAIVGGTRTSTLASSVHAQATTGFDRLEFLKSNFIPDPAPIFGGGTLSGANGAIIVIEDFQAAAICDSNSNGTGSGSAAYRASLYYWEDPVQNGNRSDGRYRRVSFDVTNTSTGVDPLPAIAAQNSNNGPLVYDHSSSNQRIYLFGTSLGKTFGTGAGTTYAAYLSSWNSIPTTASRVTTATDAAGATVATVNSSVEGAIEIQTADFDTTRQVESLLSISAGSLSCYAEDAR
jgi:prepilin-type N-terminal cleavage/methylation domain-containing protein